MEKEIQYFFEWSSGCKKHFCGRFFLTRLVFWVPKLSKESPQNLKVSNSASGTLPLWVIENWIKVKAGFYMIANDRYRWKQCSAIE